MNIRGAIFDLDGTLADSMTVWTDIDKAFFAGRKIPVPDIIRPQEIIRPGNTGASRLCVKTCAACMRSFLEKNPRLQ